MTPETDRLIRWLGRLEKQPVWVTLAGAALLALLVAGADLLTGSEISLSLFYLIPIVLVAWVRGERAGQVMAAACAGLWFLEDFLAGPGYSTRFVLMWNIATRLAIFLLVLALLARLHEHLLSESKLARTDYLTGALNARAFYERIEEELERARRYSCPFAIAYLDLDNFKEINDSFGHIAGDTTLKQVADIIRWNTRCTDVVARLGGDEFALLLPQTGKEAGFILDRLHGLLAHELEMDKEALTFSMGSTVFLTAPPSVEDAIRLVDQSMYRVKRVGKNAMEFNTYPEEVRG